MIYSLNGIETTNFYEFQEDTNHTFPDHCHYSFEVCFVKSGNIKVTREEDTCNMAAGDCILIMPFEKHSMLTEMNSEIFEFQISPKLISNWDVCFAGKTLKNACIHLSENEINDIYNSLKNMDGNLVELNYIFFKIMNLALRDNELVTHFRPDDICLEALRYIGENFTRDITLTSMAEELNVSPVYLSRVFTKKMNLRFVDCVNSFRLQEAMTLLSDKQQTISEVCYECGFGSLRQFNRLFLKTMLCTPSEYRKLNA